jgi:D-amino-acid dehydrogenase
VRVVVVGGGVIGLSVGAEVAERGHQVLVLEQDAKQLGSSLGNAGMIVPSHFIPLAAPGMIGLGLKWMWNPESPFALRPRADWKLWDWAWKFYRAATAEHVRRSGPLLRDLNMASRELYCQLSQREDFGLVRRGLLMLCKTEHALEEESRVARQAEAMGIPAQVLSLEALRKLDPAVTMDVAGGVYFPNDCHLSPDRFVAFQRKRLEKAGGKLIESVCVDRWDVDGKRVRGCHGQGQGFEADAFVLSGGAWSPKTAETLPVKLPMQAGKGYSLTLDHPVELPQICSIFTEARVAVTPMGGRLRFGGTMEISGLDTTIRPRRIDGILKSIPKYYPNFQPSHFNGIVPWYGLRPCSPDGLPYIGPVSRLENFWVATGHAMMGLSLAPITGHLIAQSIDRQPTSIDLTRLSPDRYQ